MSYVKLLLAIAAIALLASSAALAVPHPTAGARTFVEGTITALDSSASTITVTPPAPPSGSKLPAKAPVTFSVTDSTGIFLDGKTSTFTALAIDDLCQAQLVTTSAGDEAIEVSARSPRVCGTITQIDTTAEVVTIQPFTPPSEKTALPAVQLQITDSTQIIKMGTASLSDLLVGDDVVAKYQTQESGLSVALKVMVRPFEFAGKVVSVDSVGGAITVANAKSTLVLSVVSATKIVLSGKSAALSAILPKDLVEVAYFQYSGGDVASVIFAQGPVKVGPGLYVY